MFVHYHGCLESSAPYFLLGKYLFVSHRLHIMSCDDPCCIFQQSIDQIQQKWLKQGVGPFIVRTVNILILFGIKRNCLGSGRSRSFFLFIRRLDKTDFSNYRGISLLSATHKILSNILLSRLTAYAEEIIGDHQC